MYKLLYLLVKYALRDTASGGVVNATITFNGSSANQTQKNIYTDNGSSVTSYSFTDFYIWYPGASATASTFGNSEIYITNYASSNYKSFSGDISSENNSASGTLALGASLWSNTAAITSVKVTPNGGTFAQYSTAYLYGISNS